MITPLPSEISSDNPVIMNTSDAWLESSNLLYVDLQMNDFWNSVFEDSIQLKNLETKWHSVVCKIKNIMIKKASDDDLETANALLRSSYNFYRESSCVMLPSGVNLYLVPSRFVAGTQFQPSMDGVETLDLSIPRKLLLWAYTLLHGRCANIAGVVKYCEENAKVCILTCSLKHSFFFSACPKKQALVLRLLPVPWKFLDHSFPPSQAWGTVIHNVKNVFILSPVILEYTFSVNAHKSTCYSHHIHRKTDGKFELIDIPWDCGYVLQSKMKKGTGMSSAPINIPSTATTHTGCHSSSFILFRFFSRYLQKSFSVFSFLFWMRDSGQNSNDTRVLFLIFLIFFPRGYYLSWLSPNVFFYGSF